LNVYRTVEFHEPWFYLDAYYPYTTGRIKDAGPSFTIRLRLTQSSATWRMKTEHPFSIGYRQWNGGELFQQLGVEFNETV